MYKVHVKEVSIITEFRMTRDKSVISGGSCNCNKVKHASNSNGTQSMTSGSHFNNLVHRLSQLISEKKN